MATFVFVHGGWDGGWAWTPVAQRLRESGHEAFAPTLTGSGERVHLASPDVDLNTHISDVVNLLRYEDLHNVMLVGASSGGMVITGVAEQAAERINHLIYLDAFVPLDGQSISDLVGPQIGAGFLEAADAFGDGWRVPSSDPEEDRKTDSLINVGRTRLSLQNPDAAQLQRTYVLSTNRAEDYPLTPVFDQIAARIRQTEGWDYFEKPWDHYPVLDQVGGVDDVVALLLELVA